MTEEQKVKIDLLKTLFLDGALTASEFEKRRETILKESPTKIEQKSDPILVFKSEIDLEALRPSKLESTGQQLPQAPKRLTGPAKKRKEALDTLKIVGVILGAVLIFLFLNNLPSKKRQDPTKAIQESNALESKLSPEDKKRMQEQSVRLAKIDSAIAAKREKEERAQELAEERAFLKTRAGKIWNKHRDWSKEDCALLAQGKYWVGMHIDMLKYRRGLPDSANPSNYGNGTSWQWCWHDYTPSCFYDNDNDGLIDAYN